MVEQVVGRIPLVPVVAGSILLAYAGALVGLLKGESRRTLLALTGLVALVLATRLLWFDLYPPGLHEDEAKVGACVPNHYAQGDLRREHCTGLPVLLWTLFRAPLLEWLGPTRVALRAYSIATGVAAVPVGFATARALGFGVSVSLAAAALLGLLPWSLLYGRIDFGGELVFHQMLLLAGLAILVFRTGNAWFGWFLASLGQSLLLYDYFAGRLFLPFAVGAAVLATGHRRILCLLVPCAALLAWVPYLTYRPVYAGTPFGFFPPFLHESFRQFPQGLATVLQAFFRPICTEASALSVRAGAMHPEIVLVAAILGILWSVRRPRLGLFLLWGFSLGILPGVVTAQFGVSSHRIMMAYPFVALAAVVPFSSLSVPAAQRLALAGFVLTAGMQSVRFFFSPQFWHPGSRLHFAWEASGVMDAIPRPAPGKVYLARQLGYHVSFRMRFDRELRLFGMGDWLPGQNEQVTIYGFSAHAESLQGFYRELLGEHRVRASGRAFSVWFEPNDWSWLERNGWTYSAACGGNVYFGHVPVAYQPQAAVPLPPCRGEMLQLWRGRWVGPPATLRADAWEALTWVRVERTILTASGPGFHPISFRVEPGNEVELAMLYPVESIWLALHVLENSHIRVPPFAWIEPVNRCENPWQVTRPLSGEFEP